MLIAAIAAVVPKPRFGSLPPVKSNIDPAKTKQERKRQRFCNLTQTVHHTAIKSFGNDGIYLPTPAIVRIIEDAKRRGDGKSMGYGELSSVGVDIDVSVVLTALTSVCWTPSLGSLLFSDISGSVENRIWGGPIIPGGASICCLACPPGMTKEDPTTTRSERHKATNESLIVFRNIVKFL